MAKKSLIFSCIITAFWAIGTIIQKGDSLNFSEFIYDLIFAIPLWFFVGLFVFWIKDKLSHGNNLRNERTNLEVENGIPHQSDEMVSQKQAVNENLGSKTCPECSHGNPNDVLYCNYCGHKFGRICSNCGRENPTNAIICGYCGNKFPDAVSTVKTDEVVLYSEPIVQKEYEISTKPRSTRIWIISCLVIVLIIMFFYISNLYGRKIYEQSRITPVVKITLTPEPTIIPGRPTYTDAEIKRHDDLFAINAEILSCRPSEDGASIILLSKITNLKQYQVNNIIIRGRLCSPDGCGYDDSVTRAGTGNFNAIVNSYSRTPQPLPTSYKTIAEEFISIENLAGNSYKNLPITFTMPSEKNITCYVDVYIKP